MPITTTTHKNLLAAKHISTPLGTMLAIATDSGLSFLGFSDQKNLTSDTTFLQKRLQAEIIQGNHLYISAADEQLAEYFSGKRRQFTIPIDLHGSHFQKQSWNALLSIPYGETRSYKEQAISIDNPTAVRAVANANGQNPICIIIPCHRVIGSNGTLTGYSAGLPRKKWLLHHEQRFKQ